MVSMADGILRLEDSIRPLFFDCMEQMDDVVLTIMAEESKQQMEEMKKSSSAKTRKPSRRK